MSERANKSKAITSEPMVRKTIQDLLNVGHDLIDLTAARILGRGAELECTRRAREQSTSSLVGVGNSGRTGTRYEEANPYEHHPIAIPSAKAKAKKAAIKVDEVPESVT